MSAENILNFLLVSVLNQYTPFSFMKALDYNWVKSIVTLLAILHMCVHSLQRKCQHLTSGSIIPKQLLAKAAISHLVANRVRNFSKYLYLYFYPK